jgi:classical protein kinase C
LRREFLRRPSINVDEGKCIAFFNRTGSCSNCSPTASHETNHQIYRNIDVLNIPPIMKDEEKISEIYRKIEREKTLINAASAMRQQTQNQSVRDRIESQIHEGRKNIEYLEGRMQELQMKTMGQGVNDMSLGGPNDQRRSRPGGFGTPGGPPTPPPKDSRGSYGQSSASQADYGNQGPGGYQSGSQQGMISPRPFDSSNDASGAKARPNHTKLGTFVGTLSH